MNSFFFIKYSLETSRIFKKNLEYNKKLFFYKYHSDVTKKIPQAFNAYYCIYKKQN